MSEVLNAEPNLLEFNPNHIPFQRKVICDVRKQYDYSLGTHEALLSGSVGSAKSMVVAHLIATHLLFNPGANFGVCRRALPHLKATLLKKIRAHFRSTGVGVEYNKTSGDIVIPSVGSMVTAFSYADGNLEKFGSYELSSGAFEELTEAKDDVPYQMMLSRIGRVPNITEKILLSATNPDGPSHWAYKRFFEEKSPNRHVYLSRTEENPFLPRSYIEGLKANMDPKRARRLLYGEWVDIDSERIYSAYASEFNFLSNESYIVDSRYPVRMAYDFNIAKGKPLSVVFFQYLPNSDTFHFFDEVVVEGLRTRGSLEEAAGKGLLDYPTKYIVHGDASGKHGDTRNNLSDYDIIQKYLNEYKQKSGAYIQFEIDVPQSNPPIRTRHNLVNAYCCNEQGLRRLFVYGKAKTLDEAFRLTQLKDKAQYLEDDSKAFQHIGTSAGYGLNSTLQAINLKAPSMVARR